MAYESRAIDRSIGCAAVIPGALIGLAGLADGGGPGGWRVFAEFFGWIATCVAVSLFIAALLSRARQSGARRYRAAALTTASIVLFTFIPHYIGWTAPMPAKIAFTTTLQVLGVSAVVVTMAFISYIAWDQGRNR